MATDQVQAKPGIHTRDVGIPFGWKEERLVAPLEVPRGLACGCRCPECKAPLVAKRGRCRRPHFAHYGTSPGAGCAETAIHLYAKQVLVQATKLHLPAWTGAADMPNPPQASDAFGLVQRGEKVHWPRCVSEVWGGEQELPRDGIRPDVIVQDTDGELLVEVRVTHAVGQDKARAVRRLDLRMVEIDLSSTSAAVLADPAAFERWVLQEAPRHWIWLPAAARKWTESLRRLEDEIKLRGTPRSHIERPKPVAPPVPSPALAGWGEFRTLFAAREIESVDREPRVRDPLVGGTVTLPGLGIAKILERFARASRVYRVALADGSLRTIYLGHEPAGGLVTSADCRSAGARGSAKLLRPPAALAAD